MSVARLTVLTTVLLLLSGGASVASAQSDSTRTEFEVDAGLAEKGATLFENEQCAQCHNIGGKALIGPDLEGLLERRELGWVRKMIASPEAMTKKDSTARALKEEFGGIQMPDPGLSEEEITAIIHYIASESSGG